MNLFLEAKDSILNISHPKLSTSTVHSFVPFPYNTISFRAYYQQVHVEVAGEDESRVKYSLSTCRDCDRDEYLQFRVHIQH